VVLGREVTTPLVLLADCEVHYDGRARSTLRRGHYLLIRKRDGSFLVHGARLTTPLNYQPAGSRLFRTEEGFFCQGRDESIRVVVHRRPTRLVPDPWDDHPIELARTERELADRLARRIARHIPGVVEVHREYPTEHGAVDLVAIDECDVYHVIEVKRARATTHAAVQVRKYLEALADDGRTVRGYVAAPTITATALAYCQKHGLGYIDIQHAGRSSRDKSPVREEASSRRSARRSG
jgi:RecB family endonuclease NucS